MALTATTFFASLAAAARIAAEASASWTVVVDSDAADRALRCARGSYQRHLLAGVENLSGSTLSGRAREYGVHYARSRRNLLGRISAAGVAWREIRAARGRRVLVLGA